MGERNYQSVFLKERPPVTNKVVVLIERTYVSIKINTLNYMPLKRSRNSMIAGVCGGLAEWLGWNPTVVRIAYVLISIFSAAFPGILVYIILWIIMPPPD